MSNKPLPDPNFLPPDVCPALQTKSLALNTHYESTAFEARAQSNVAIFYCMKTYTSFGPDDIDVGPAECRSNRECWCGDPEI